MHIPIHLPTTMIRSQSDACQLCRSEPHSRNDNIHGTRHYNDVTMSTMASQMTSLTIVYSTVIPTQIKENVKAPRHWPFCEEFTGTGQFPTQRASNAENVSIWWRRHHGWCQFYCLPLSQTLQRPFSSPQVSESFNDSTMLITKWWRKSNETLLWAWCVHIPTYSLTTMMKPESDFCQLSRSG